MDHLSCYCRPAAVKGPPEQPQSRVPMQFKTSGKNISWLVTFRNYLVCWPVGIRRGCARRFAINGTCEVFLYKLLSAVILNTFASLLPEGLFFFLIESICITLSGRNRRLRDSSHDFSEVRRPGRLILGSWTMLFPYRHDHWLFNYSWFYFSHTRSINMLSKTGTGSWFLQAKIMNLPIAEKLLI